MKIVNSGFLYEITHWDPLEHLRPENLHNFRQQTIRMATQTTLHWHTKSFIMTAKPVQIDARNRLKLSLTWRQNSQSHECANSFTRCKYLAGYSARVAESDRAAARTSGHHLFKRDWISYTSSNVFFFFLYI